MRELFAPFAVEHALDLDLSSTAEGMARWGFELYSPLEAPAGMPKRHWWWFADRPP